MGHTKEEARGMDFERYAVSTVTPEYFEIGCHKIQFSELDSVARLACLINPEYTMATGEKEN